MDWVKRITAHGSPLYVFPMPNSETFAFGVLIKVGTRDEIWPQEAGIAHALEHMFFQGTEKFPDQRELSAVIEDIGGVVNAWTASEMTFYHNSVPAGYQDESVMIVSQQVLHSLFPEDKITTEMNNIVAEIHRAFDMPDRLANIVYEKALYGSHPLGRLTLGIEGSVKAFSRKSFVDFMARTYSPEKFAYITAGKIEPDEALELVHKYFPLTAGKPSHSHIFTSITDAKKEVFVEKNINQVNFVLGAPIGAASDRSSIALDIFQTMVDGGMSFPLFQEIRQKRGPCYALKANSDRWSDIGNFSIYIGTSPDKVDEFIKVAHGVIQASKRNSDLLAKAKTLRKGQMALRRQATLNIITLAAFDLSSGDEPKTLKQAAKEIDSITIEEVEAAVDRYLKPEQFTVAKVGPKQK